MTDINPQIEDSWKNALKKEFQSESFSKLKEFLVDERSEFNTYPPGPQIFSAFKFTPLNNVRVVILGQDPYHGAGQAHGLCFSVPHGIKPPPSLVNIFKEIKMDLNYDIPSHGNLESWAKQGVMLLNATLTVRASTPGSHQKKGWEQFTDIVIQRLSDQKEGLVFLLWGNFAISKSKYIDTQRHHILTSVHPSPLSAHRGFLGCKHFSKANELLKSQGKPMIDWKLE